MCPKGIIRLQLVASEAVVHHSSFRVHVFQVLFNTPQASPNMPMLRVEVSDYDLTSTIVTTFLRETFPGYSDHHFNVEV